jgi:hypothetical protein
MKSSCDYIQVKINNINSVKDIKQYRGNGWNTWEE